MFELPKSSVHKDKWIEFLKLHNIEYCCEKKYFLCILEFIYRQLNCFTLCSDPSFNQKFINTVIAQIEVDFEHCQDTIDKLLKVFVEFRVKLQFQSRLVHKRNNFASKNNYNKYIFINSLTIIYFLKNLTVRNSSKFFESN